MVTLHPIVAYFKDEQGKLSHKSFVIVSDSLSHNASAVYAFIKAVMPHLMELTRNTTWIHYLTDSPTSQYRNKYIFYLLTKHEELFQCGASWNYFEAGHGKGPCDGIGAVAKRMADSAVKQQKATIQDAREFFAWAKTTDLAVSYLFVDKEEVTAGDEAIRSVPVKPLYGTTKLHAIFPLENNEIAHRETSCFCPNCFSGRKLFPECDGWKVEALHLKEVATTPVGDQDEHPTNEEQDVEVHDGEWVAAVYDANWYVEKSLK